MVVGVIPIDLLAKEHKAIYEKKVNEPQVGPLNSMVEI